MHVQYYGTCPIAIAVESLREAEAGAAVAMASTGRWLDKVVSEQWVGAELSLRPRPPLVVFD